ncbi:MAG TPA: ATP-binding cassette domain-containing protein [Bdellovibrionota bacterium]|jgi:ABC-type multidrug transport system ATPase subunit|nr:ATP-binding cassette domain-containing protein [Bdellovibrionota bacterium]
MTIWKTSHLSAGYNPTEGRIQNLNFELARGERVAILGGERSGSYMLLRVLCGLRPRREGELRVFGEEAPRLEFFDDWEHIFPRSLRTRMGVALERDGLLANVAIREGFETVIRFGGGRLWDVAQVRTRVQAVLELFGIAALSRFRPHQLSLAERRFAALARAALLEPEVYLFEGPSKGLDDRDRERLVYAFDKLVVGRSDQSLIMATEDWALAMRYCPRVVVMEEGRIIFDGIWADMAKGCPQYWESITNSLKRRWELDAPLRAVV